MRINEGLQKYDSQKYGSKKYVMRVTYFNEKIWRVMGEMIVDGNTIRTGYIEDTEEAIETSFQALEIANAVFMGEGFRLKEPKLSTTSLKATKFMLEEGVFVKFGKLIEIPEKKDKYGLGYIPTKADQENAVKEKRESKLARWENRLPPKLESLIEQEVKIIQPYQELVEVINLGTEHDKKEVKIGMSMKESEREKLVKILIDYVDVFAWSYQDMPGLDTNIVEHKLPLKPECAPIKQKLRRMRPDMSLKIREEVKKQFDAGFLAVAKYPQWVANIVPVPKKDGKVRMCVDYRDLNKASPKDDFPLPHIDVLVDSTAQYSLFSFMDGFSGYNQIKMAPEDMEKTTFIIQWGTFYYKVMPFGLKNAGATYQRAMVTLFHDMMHKEIKVYVDDMIAKSRTEEEHVINLQKLFVRLRKFRLRLNPAKCTFGVRSDELLGFIVGQKGIEVDPDKVRAIQEMPAPRTEKEVRGFLGRLNYIARFISHLTATCEPIFKLLRKDQKVEWNDNCQKAFEKIKQYLSKPPILVPPVPEKPLIMYLTVLDESMGCVLGQHDESGRKEHAIYYLSKKFTSCETRYSLLERTCCALAWAARRLRQYMLCHTTWLVSKMDPIKYIFEKPALNRRIARWQMLLSEYDLVYVTQKSIKGSALAEYLAQQPVEDYQSMQCEFPDEDIMNLVEEIESSDKEKWRLVFDGASNALGHGIGAILISPENQFTPFTARLCFDCTNNIAEYEACVMGIKAAIESNVKFLEVYGDSLLVIHQTKGDWETRDSKLIPYHTHIKELTEQFEKITFHHIPREENQLADALATLSSMFKITTNQDVPVIKIQQRDKPAYCLSIEEELDEYPSGISENDKRVLRRLSMNFFLNGDVLYKRNHDMVLLRCVDKAEAEKIIQEVHEGSFGTHANEHAMARKILRAGYYWLTMESDCFNYVKKCHKCQIYADKVHVLPTSLNVLTSQWPFSMWEMDVIELIEPKASNGHRFILVAIDYFTKWVEAASYANVTRSVVVKFIKRELICRYGLPNKIITDNATNLNNKMMKELCDSFKIQHHNSSPYRPKMNGAVEAANKNIKKIIQKMVETYKDWHEMLPFALHGYRTSVRTSTGATPFSLVYGMEAVLPIEVEIPSIRVLMETKLEEAEWVQSRFDQLNLIEEKRMIALCHDQLYQKRLKKAYEKKVRPREFQEGDLVLKKILPIKKDFRGKWTPNYEGPYVVKKAFSGGALILAEMDGDDLPLPVNSDAVKKYYA
uniref:Protein NYNRIN-like n=1 Tax=Cicer arietinum TaxID=3827 RepID=A0A3Q7YES0_CICAR|nr:protein NYNRIN-like [Cicer arietinum]